MKPVLRYALAATLLALLGLVAIDAWVWRSMPGREQPPGRAASAAMVLPAPPSEPDAPASTVKHPIELAEGEAPAARDLESALTDLVGRKSVLALFQTDDFPRRVAATVDNLGRRHAPARLWPVNPAHGRFIVERKGDAEVIGADNGFRYVPFVLLIETLDLRQAVAFYKTFYPEFQRAYEELGYPNRYFNDRLVEVIDQLLDTPDIADPVKVHLPTINGPIQPPRPWVLYEFDDPALQALSAGQKILLRMGPVNVRRMKAKLAEFRRLATGGTAPR